MLAIASARGLCALEFDSAERHARLDHRLARWFPPHEIHQINAQDDRLDGTLAAAGTWLRMFFDGRDPSALPPVPLDLRGAVFERRVWAALVDVPPGTTASYRDIAERIGAPRAVRAVGAANGRNPVALIVPCHRIIGANGTLTGYGGGLDRKRQLLDHERRWNLAPARLF